MVIFVTKSFLIFLILFQKNVLSSELEEEEEDLPAVLVVSFDGFRPDFITKELTPNLYKLKEIGQSPEYMRNVFPTKTFTNHHSIATGLYAESHGVMANSLYDPGLKKVISNTQEFWNFNGAIDPIWIHNEEAGGGRRSGVMWPGAEMMYQGVHPTFYEPFDPKVPYEERVDKMFEWFLHPNKSINLGMLYFENPDSIEHMFGTNSSQVRNIIQKMDNVTAYILQKLDETGLKNKINFFLLSDHGMDQVKIDGMIDLRKYVNESWFIQAGASAILQIIPKEGYIDEVYDKLKEASEIEGFNVYKREEFPDRWYYSRNPRSPPIIVLAKPGHAFQDVWLRNGFQSLEEAIKWYKNNHSIEEQDIRIGCHGYDPNVESMRPLLIAFGPAIRNDNHECPPFNNTDLFSLWSHILDLPQIPTNGSLDNIRLLLRSSQLSSIKKEPLVAIQWSTISFISVGGIFCIVSIGIILYTSARATKRLLRKRDYNYFMDSGYLQMYQENQHLLSEVDA